MQTNAACGHTGSTTNTRKRPHEEGSASKNLRNAKGITLVWDDDATIERHFTSIVAAVTAMKTSKHCFYNAKTMGEPIQGWRIKGMRETGTAASSVTSKNAKRAKTGTAAGVIRSIIGAKTPKTEEPRLCGGSKHGGSKHTREPDQKKVRRAAFAQTDFARFAHMVCFVG